MTPAKQQIPFYYAHNNETDENTGFGQQNHFPLNQKERVNPEKNNVEMFVYETNGNLYHKINCAFSTNLLFFRFY